MDLYSEGGEIMPVRTQGLQAPYGIKGTVTYNSSVYQGARIWIRDVSEGTVPSYEEDYTYVYTNVSGQYIINLAQSTQAYSNSDSVRVYCQIGDIIDYSDITVNKLTGFSTVNFSITRKSALVDGCKGSPLTSGKGGLHKEITKGCIDGLK